MPYSNLVNQMVVIGLAVFGGLYVYRSIETRIVALESRVSVLEATIPTLVRKIA